MTNAEIMAGIAGALFDLAEAKSDVAAAESVAGRPGPGATGMSHSLVEGRRKLRAAQRQLAELESLIRADALSPPELRSRCAWRATTAP